MSLRSPGWLAPACAAVAFVAVLVVFGRELAGFRRSVEEWARRDLHSQARLAAATLDEPLRTQDFRRIGEIAADLRTDHNLQLTVYSRRGGVFYSTSPRVDSDLRESASADEFRIELSFPRELVFLPFHRALMGFVLAALVGVLGMAFVFFALYRQHVKIRELARLERFRREFVADVSHEIKTPLTGILGAVDLLKDAEGEASSPMRAKLLVLVARESGRLNALVQQILDLARLEREGTFLNRVRTDVDALVREVVDECAPTAAAKGVTLNVSPAADGGAACFVSCDAPLVAQALSNLVTNAIRHSGSPTVEVSARTARHAVQLVVEDRGIGIPEEHARRVFERFHRVDPSRAAESGGAGLGLSIVRRIARLHGGDVTLEGVRPQGARFVLSLPRG